MDTNLITENQKPQIKISVFEDSIPVFSTEFSDRIELGRQQYSEPTPYVHIGDRVVVASGSESEISRRHVLVEAIDDSKVAVTNQSAVNGIQVGNSKTIKPKHKKEIQLPVVISIGNRLLEIDVSDNPKTSVGVLDSLAVSPTPPGRKRSSNSSLDEILSSRNDKEKEYLVKGLHVLNGVFQQATDTADFFNLAIEGMIDVVGMESAAVLLLEEPRSQNEFKWKTECVRQRNQEKVSSDWSPSQTVLNHVLKNKRTFWRIPSVSDPTVPSLIDVKGLIAAPMLNNDGEVIGVLYGDRVKNEQGEFSFEINEVDAILVETIASGVAAGLARIQHQKEADRTRVLFEQFFTPELSRELESTPDLLVGKDEQVSLLFCEIQGFSEFSEKLGARLTLDWINDALGTLSDCIAEFDGTLVDMMGDELIGMWGAPKQCDEHAVFACQAATRMFQQLPHLNRRWQKALDKPMNLAIGIHSGVARVGNIGSHRKFKYGPMGQTVRIAIQTQRTTKELNAKIIVTGATRDLVNEEFATRKLNDLIDKHSDQSFEMYELMADPPADWSELKRRYEVAVDCYNKQDYPTAIGLLAKILATHPGDRPSLQLMSLINTKQSPKPWTI